MADIATLFDLLNDTGCPEAINWLLEEGYVWYYAGGDCYMLADWYDWQ